MTYLAKDTVSSQCALLSSTMFLDHGLLKVETTTRGNDNGSIEFKTNASHSLGNEKLTGGVDIKYKVPQYGRYLLLDLPLLFTCRPGRN